jgi:hypothetical protein
MGWAQDGIPFISSNMVSVPNGFLCFNGEVFRFHRTPQVIQQVRTFSRFFKTKKKSITVEDQANFASNPKLDTENSDQKSRQKRVIKTH